MKFKLDENLGTLGKALLAAAGHDVMTIAEQQMSGADDRTVYEVCRDEWRVLITLDHDFGQTLRFAPEATAGIVILECRGRQTPATIVARIKELIAVMATRPIAQELWIVEPGRVRIHEKR
jgi:predicted nuclease of predicted toxin-antitoxin system